MVMIFFFIILFLIEWLSAMSFRFFFFEKYSMKKIFVWSIVPLLISVIFGWLVLFVFDFNYQYLRYTLIFYSITFYFLFLIPKIIILFFYPWFYVLKKMKKNFYKTAITKGFLILLSGSVFLIMLYGIVIGKEKLTITKIDLKIEQLPESFDNFKIVQFSDLHLGSFWGQRLFLDELVDSCNSQKPDLVVFSGDMVNQFSDEMVLMDTLFKRMKANYGKYAVLGNHDFGDYTIWKSPAEKEKNTNDIIRMMQINDFRYLRNEHVFIHKGNDSVALVGVDNWGLKPFKQYGDLKKAIIGLPINRFSLIISHDPTHWDEQIKKTFSSSLTFSGHTHAFQLGINIGNLTWSPSSFKYPTWWGMYSEKNNYLYVCRGIGTIGFMGRIGMFPEMVVITLKRK